MRPARRRLRSRAMCEAHHQPPLRQPGRRHRRPRRKRKTTPRLLRGNSPDRLKHRTTLSSPAKAGESRAKPFFPRARGGKPPEGRGGGKWTRRLTPPARSSVYAASNAVDLGRLVTAICKLSPY